MKYEFNEETAKAIIKKFNLDEKTIIKWRFRKEIPAKYFKEKIVDDSINAKIIEIIEMREISARHFRLFKGKGINTPYRLKTKEYTLTSDELILFKTEVTELRNLIQKCIVNVESQANFKKLISDDRIMYSTFISQKIAERIRTNFFLEKHEAVEIKQILSILHNKLLIK